MRRLRTIYTPFSACISANVMKKYIDIHMDRKALCNDKCTCTILYIIYIYICRVRAARDCTPKYHHYINNLWQSNVIDISFLQSNVMNPPEGPMASILTGPKGICGPPQHRGMGPWWKRTIGWSPICQSPFSWWNLCVACGLELQHRFVTQSV